MRVSDGLQPTGLADAFYPGVQRLCEESEQLFENARAQAKNAKTPLRIGATFSAVETAFPLLPIVFARDHPHIELELVEMPDREVEAKAACGEIEGALVIGPATALPEIHATCVHRESTAMLASIDNPLA